MRRWILVFLLAVLPLQSAQAMAAVYCGHEPSPAVAHIGHHAHEHHAPSTDAAGAAAADPVDAPSGAADTDCDYCHLSGAQPVASFFPVWMGTPDRPAARGRIPAFASREGGRIDRPNWSSAACPVGGQAVPED